jgi:DNA-binding GntR family transcriptional regulator
MHSSTYRNRQSASEFAYHELRRKIIELEFSPGMHLSEETLSKDLEVSRTPLRQGLYRLELEGLVIKHPNGRLYVAPITVEEAKEVFLVREVLEGLLAREATKNVTTDQLQQLEDSLELMRRAAEQNRNQDTIKYGSTFHHILHSVSNNQTAKRFLDQLNSRIERYRRLGGYKNPSYIPLLPVQEHEQIFDLIKKGEASQVEEAMRSHIRRSLLSTVETLQLYLSSIHSEDE